MKRNFKVKTIVILSMLLLPPTVLAEEITIKVKGMVCSLCAQGIEKKFKAMDEVKDIKVNLGDKVVTVSTKDEKSIPDDKITKIITEAGYNVSNIERK